MFTGASAHVCLAYYPISSKSASAFPYFLTVESSTMQLRTRRNEEKKEERGAGIGQSKTRDGAQPVFPSPGTISSLDTSRWTPFTLPAATAADSLLSPPLRRANGAPPRLYVLSPTDFASLRGHPARRSFGCFSQRFLKPPWLPRITAFVATFAPTAMNSRRYPPTATLLSRRRKAMAPSPPMKTHSNPSSRPHPVLPPLWCQGGGFVCAGAAKEGEKAGNTWTR